MTKTKSYYYEEVNGRFEVRAVYIYSDQSVFEACIVTVDTHEEAIAVCCSLISKRQGN